MTKTDDWFNLLDIDSVADVDDKLRECEFFYFLAAKESDKSRFRWLTSAFLNAAYSYFESSAMYGYVHITDLNGKPVEDANHIDVLRKHIGITQSSKNPYFVKTSGKTELTNSLYDFRKKSAHHWPLSIMQAGPALPEDFHFGSVIGEGTPSLSFCREVLNLIQKIHEELHQ